MEDQPAPSHRSSSELESGARSAGSWIARSGRFVATHPVGLARGTVAALVAVVVLQNMEPTSLDFLFWRIAEVPKLLILLVAMVLGGVLWELLRRLVIGSRARSGAGGSGSSRPS
jgi:uncharacterized integral membrane protein